MEPEATNREKAEEIWSSRIDRCACSSDDGDNASHKQVFQTLELAQFM